jgi:hypothetical protein
MNHSVSAIAPGRDGYTIYMLHWGGSYERSYSGPYTGPIGLDFVALTKSYRESRYGAAQAKQEDYCFLGEDDFASWLVENKILSPIETSNVDIDILDSSDYTYTPNHWPLCPQCGLGRGEKEYGGFRNSLNRVKTFRRCTECRYEWGHQEEANHPDLPMLDDDGRDTPGACVPFAISKACRLDFWKVLQVCTNHGWSRTGMVQVNGIAAARELGFSLTSKSWVGVGSSSAPTIKRLLPHLTPGYNYVIGVKGHWLAVVDGQIVDNDSNTGPGCKVRELYEVKPL